MSGIRNEFFSSGFGNDSRYLPNRMNDREMREMHTEIMDDVDLGRVSGRVRNTVSLLLGAVMIAACGDAPASCDELAADFQEYESRNKDCDTDSDCVITSTVRVPWRNCTLSLSVTHDVSRIQRFNREWDLCSADRCSSLVACPCIPPSAPSCVNGACRGG